MEQNVRKKILSEDNEEVEPLKVYVGWDSREDIAFQVCKQSIIENASVPVKVIPLKQDSLRKKDLYWRAVDALASTEFTFTRFLVPNAITLKDGHYCRLRFCIFRRCKKDI